jgi:DNA repair protein RecO
MKQLADQSIVLTRTQYGEADRIVTVLTPEHGKVRLVAKGVRKPKSKLAAGIELLTVSHISFIAGKGDLATLVSARAQEQFQHVTTDLDRTTYAYEMLKCIMTITEDDAGPEYFSLLITALRQLDDMDIPLAITSTWFDLHILALTGHEPNFHTDTTGAKLSPDDSYVFSYDDMCFVPSTSGSDDARLVKFLRLAIATDKPRLLASVEGAAALLPQAKNLANTMRKHTLRV